jgi:signal transduction histidine kinase
MADLIGDLPETAVSNFVDGPASSGRVELVDSNDQTIYQWGPFERPTDLKPIVEVPVSAPLSSWRLKYYLADDNLVTEPGRSAYFNLFAALTVIGIGLVGLAIYFARQYSREMRESRQRVNFVNQVSHELNTPLTNIRMYADLMEYDVQELESGDTEKLQSRLNVIVSESQRLSRLIGNVLTFARQQRSKSTLHMRPDQVDRVVSSVIERLRPELDERGIKVTFDGKAGATVKLDDDAVEQILLNLFSNVAKYAASGKTLRVDTRRQGQRTTIEVADDGPGIPTHEREKIFQPFYRLSDKIEGVAGTGIGLTIARELARVHCGDLKLLKSTGGCRFQVELHTPEAVTQS